jgi:tetrahydromethanopterin S-methyltransferase subunit F
MTNELDTNELNETTLTKDIKKSIEDIIYQKKSIARDQEALKEAIEATAQKLGVKKGVLSRRIDLIIKEEEKGGEVKSKSADIEFVEKYFDISN